LKTFKKIVMLKIMFVLLVSIIAAFECSAFASDSKDVILVLDTSLSMVGYGGAYKSKNILNQVKSSIANYIDGLEDGDRVTFLTFDTEVRIYPTIYVDDDNDRDILKKYISMTEAKGAWTNTFYMIQAAFQKADKLEKEEDNQIVIVVMTDGIDDPPPYSKHKRLNIKEISSRFNNKDWWVYLVNLNEVKESKKVAALKSELEKVSKHTTVIEAGQDPTKGIEKDLPEDIKEKENGAGRVILSILIALIVIIIVLGLIYYFYQFSTLKVAGTLEYWNNEVLDPYITTYDLNKRAQKTITIGKGFDSNVTIRDIAINQPFSITAVRVEKLIKFVIQPGGKYPIEFINKEHGQYLENGDIFKVANYTFKYTNAV